MCVCVCVCVCVSWAEPDFRYLQREVGIHSNTQTCNRGQKSGGTNQIAVFASSHVKCIFTPTRSTLPPTSYNWHMPASMPAYGQRNQGKNFVGWRIAGGIPP